MNDNSVLSGNKKQTSKQNSTQKKIGKIQKVNIFISVYRYKDKILSAHGIQHSGVKVVHNLIKHDFKFEELFEISSYLTSHHILNETETKNLTQQILDNKCKTFIIPEMPAQGLPNIGNLTHEILEIDIELVNKI